MKKVVIGLLATLIVALLINAVMTIASMPDVYFSHSDGTCVKVINYADGDTFSCEKLPSRYNHVWVK